jgi:hypothetical protein
VAGPVYFFVAISNQTYSEKKIMENSVKSNLRNLRTWERFLYMVLFAIVLAILDIVLLAVVMLQVILSLITGFQNDRARKFGGELGLYSCQIYHFLTYYSEFRPFPFSDWPLLDKTDESSASQPPRAEETSPEPANRSLRKVKKTENKMK